MVELVACAHLHYKHQQMEFACASDDDSPTIFCEMKVTLTDVPLKVMSYRSKCMWPLPEAEFNLLSYITPYALEFFFLGGGGGGGGQGLYQDLECSSPLYFEIPYLFKKKICLYARVGYLYTHTFDYCTAFEKKCSKPSRKAEWFWHDLSLGAFNLIRAFLRFGGREIYSNTHDTGDIQCSPLFNFMWKICEHNWGLKEECNILYLYRFLLSLQFYAAHFFYSY